jgi:hypothetical protein
VVSFADKSWQSWPLERPEGARAVQGREGGRVAALLSRRSPLAERGSYRRQQRGRPHPRTLFRAKMRRALARARTEAARTTVGSGAWGVKFGIFRYAQTLQKHPILQTLQILPGFRSGPKSGEKNLKSRKNLKGRAFEGSERGLTAEEKAPLRLLVVRGQGRGARGGLRGMKTAPDCPSTPETPQTRAEALPRALRTGVGVGKGALIS